MHHEHATCTKKMLCWISIFVEAVKICLFLFHSTLGKLDGINCCGWVYPYSAAQICRINTLQML